MKISKLKIRNLFGIREYDSDGQNVELQGSTGAGKTSVLDAIKYALTNKSDREYIIYKGEQEGEVFVETDTGLSIHRKARTNKADYKSIKQFGDKVEKNETFIRQFFTELQLNPIEFSKMTVQEQNRIILDLIDFKWDTNWIQEQFGEIPSGVDYEQNILCVLHDIQSDKGNYFQKREEINRDRRHKQAFIEEIGLKLPKGYNAKVWEDKNLGEIYTKIEKIRNENDRIKEAKTILEGADDKKNALLNSKLLKNEQLINEEKDAIRNQEIIIEELQNKIQDAKNRISTIQRETSHAIELLDGEYKLESSKLAGEIEQVTELAKGEIKDYSELQAEATHTEEMKAFINEYKRMVDLQKQVEDLTNQSEDLTTKIEKARTLPGEILENSNIPVEGLTIKDGIPLINGLPISNLSDGEKFELCISVAIKNPEALQMLLIDGIEKLSSEKREKVYSNLKKRGVQFIATRTTDDEDLTVIQL